MERKHTIFLTVVAVATLLIVLVGSTFAYFAATVTKTGSEDDTQTVIKTASLGITYDAGSKVVLGTEEQGIFPGATGENSFSVSNTGDYDTPVDITWIELTNDFTGNDLVYTLTRTDLDGVSNSQVVKEETVIPKTDDADKLIIKETIPAKSGYKYKLNVSFKETNVDQSADKGKTFDGKINIEVAASDSKYTTNPSDLNS